jgi:hypothetical protein
VNWKGFGRKPHNFRYNPGAWLEELRKPMIICPNSQPPRRDLNPGPAESEDPACYEMLRKLLIQITPIIFFGTLAYLCKEER